MLTLIVLVSTEQHAATDVIMPAMKLLAMVGLAAGVYDGYTPVVVCSC